MKTYNKLIEGIHMPARIAKLPVHNGYPVPWFVPWIEGEPHPQAADPARLKRAVQFARCWICGEELGVYRSFVIGPMCMVNRITSEPPSHYECAEYAVKACPFLINPKMKRNHTESALHHKPDGIMIERNPGVAVLWVTKPTGSRRFTIPGGGKLIKLIAEPSRISFWREGREATRAEVLESINTGMPLLREACNEEPKPEDALAEMEVQYKRALELLPAEAD